MDRLKLYACIEGDLNRALWVVQEYTRNTEIELGLDKCAVVDIKNGRMTEFPNEAQLIDSRILRHLSVGETCKYLGVEQYSIQEVIKTKEALLRRCRTLCQ